MEPFLLDAIESQVPKGEARDEEGIQSSRGNTLLLPIVSKSSSSYVRSCASGDPVVNRGGSDEFDGGPGGRTRRFKEFQQSSLPGESEEPHEAEHTASGNGKHVRWADLSDTHVRLSDSGSDSSSRPGSREGALPLRLQSLVEKARDSQCVSNVWLYREVEYDPGELWWLENWDDGFAADRLAEHLAEAPTKSLASPQASPPVSPLHGSHAPGGPLSVPVAMAVPVPGAEDGDVLERISVRPTHRPTRNLIGLFGVAADAHTQVPEFCPQAQSEPTPKDSLPDLCADHEDD